jgi:hypothetical protein
MTQLRVIVGAIVVAAMFAVLPGAAAASRSCGTFHADGAKLAVTILRGHVTCDKARRVLRAFFAGKGRMHEPPGGPAAQQTWTVQGWTCGYGTGGGGCIRYGSSFQNARKWIEANAVGRIHGRSVLSANAAVFRTCPGVAGTFGGGTSAIRARDTSCHEARRVARAWLRSGCSTRGIPCHVRRFTCASYENRHGAVVTTCFDNRKKLHFSSD